MDESLEVMVARTDDGARLPTRGSEYVCRMGSLCLRGVCGSI